MGALLGSTHCLVSLYTIIRALISPARVSSTQHSRCMDALHGSYKLRITGIQYAKLIMELTSTPKPGLPVRLT